SAAENGGAISPAAKVWIWNLLSVASPTAFANTSAAPCSVSSDLGKLVVSRHFSSGIDWAMAGAEIAVAAAPTAMPAVFNSLRRLTLVMIGDPPVVLRGAAALTALPAFSWRTGEPSSSLRGTKVPRPYPRIAQDLARCLGPR